MFLRLKGRRASQAVAAEEAPMFERSEFGRRAAAAEKRRALGERSSASGRQEQAVLVTFAKTKVNRAQRESLGLDLTTSAGRVLLTFVAMVNTRHWIPAFAGMTSEIIASAADRTTTRPLTLPLLPSNDARPLHRGTPSHHPRITCDRRTQSTLARHATNSGAQNRG